MEALVLGPAPGLSSDVTTVVEWPVRGFQFLAEIIQRMIFMINCSMPSYFER